MKKSALYKDLFRELFRSKSRYLSILILIGIGSFVFTGLFSSGSLMREELDEFSEVTSMYDLVVTTPMGLEMEDRAIIERTEGVKRFSYSFVADFVDETDDDRVFRLLSLTEDISVPYLLEGRLPSAPNEAVLDAEYMEFGKIGDTVRLAPDQEDDPLTLHEFVITGFGVHPESMSRNYKGNGNKGDGTVDHVMIVSPDAFDNDVADPVRARLVFTDTAALLGTSDEYRELVKNLKTDLERRFSLRLKNRESQMKLETTRSLAEAKREVEDGEQKLSDAEAELRDARQELNSGTSEYYEKKREFETEITDARVALAEAERELEAGYRTLVKSQSDLEEGKKKLASGIAEGTTKLNAGAAELTAARKKLDEGRVEYEKGLAQLEEALSLQRKPLDEAQEKLNQASAELTAAESEYDEKRSEAYVQLDAAALEIESAKAVSSGALGEVEAGLSQMIDAELQLQLELESGAVTDAEYWEKVAQLSETKAELEANKLILLQSEAELELAAAALSQKRQETEISLGEGKVQLDGARAEFEAGLAEFEAGKAQFDSAKRTAMQPLLEAKEALDSGEREYKTGYDTWLAGKQTLEREKRAGELQIQEAQAKLTQGWSQYREGYRAWVDGVQELDQGVKEGEEALFDAYQALLDGEDAYQVGLAEFESEKAKALPDLADAKEKIADGEELLLKLKLPRYNVSTRYDDFSYFGIYDDSYRIDSLAQVIPLFMYFIALLLSLTTMTRMVLERRGQIGTMKMLGYGRSDILKKYLYYGGSAGLLGSVVGGLLGDFVLAPIVFDIYSSFTHLTPITRRFHGLFFFTSIALGLLFTVLATWIALRSELKQNTATLLRQKPPRSGNRILLEYIKPLWKRMSFFMKVTARNIFRYKVRMLMTLFGVAACTGLIYMGIGMLESIRLMGTIQFAELMQFDITSYYNAEGPDKDLTSYREFIEQDDRILYRVGAITDSATFEYRENTENLRIIAPEDKELFQKMVVLRDHNTKVPIEIPKEGAVLTKKTAEILELNAGDPLTITDADGEPIRLQVAAITENYLGNYLYMDPAYYEQVFSKSGKPNADYLILADSSKDSIKSFSMILFEQKAVGYLNTITDYAADIENTSNNLRGVVGIILILSCTLATVVLYSLTNINIEERNRELSTIKVLGFYPREMDRYIFRETGSLTVLGILLGFFVGILLHGFLIDAISPPSGMMVREISPINHLYAALFTVSVSVLVMVIMHRKLKRINMVEALKTIE